MSPGEKAKIDQGIASLVEHLPVTLAGLFRGLQREGFSESQSIELLKAFIVATFSGQKNV